MMQSSLVMRLMLRKAHHRTLQVIQHAQEEAQLVGSAAVHTKVLAVAQLVGQIPQPQHLGDEAGLGQTGLPHIHASDFTQVLARHRNRIKALVTPDVQAPDLAQARAEMLLDGSIDHVEARLMNGRHRWRQR